MFTNIIETQSVLVLDCPGGIQGVGVQGGVSRGCPGGVHQYWGDCGLSWSSEDAGILFGPVVDWLC